VVCPAVRTLYDIFSCGVVMIFAIFFLDLIGVGDAVFAISCLGCRSS